MLQLRDHLAKDSKLENFLKSKKILITHIFILFYVIIKIISLSMLPPLPRNPPRISTILNSCFLPVGGSTGGEMEKKGTFVRY